MGLLTHCPLGWINFPRKSRVSFKYKSTNGKHIIRIHMAENTLACHNRCSIFVTLSVQLSTEEFLQYYTMDLDEETDFVMEEFFIALGKESVKSKFFHLFSIIEFIEKSIWSCPIQSSY